VTPTSKGEAAGGGITAVLYGKVRLMWRVIDSDDAFLAASRNKPLQTSAA
jgi:hypothetical protein